MTTLCAKCQKNPDPQCDGRGFVRKPDDDTSVGQCQNLLQIQIRNLLGHEIADAGVVHSPLYVLPDDKGAVVEDKTTKNLWIKAKWGRLLPHFKWALSLKLRFTGLMFTFRVIDDAKIKSVFVGSESYKARPSSVRDDVQVYNTLEDLAGPDIDLVIIRLGSLGYKNKSAPGALKETLLMRDSAKKATWLVEEEDDPNRPWLHSRDEDVEFYVQSRYEVIKLGSPNSVGKKGEEDEEETGGVLVDEDDNGSPTPIQVSERPRRTWQPPVEDSDNDDIGGGFLSGGKKKFRKGGW